MKMKNTYGVGKVLAALVASALLVIAPMAMASTTTAITGGEGTVRASGQTGTAKAVHFTHTLTSETYGTGIAWTRATMATALGCAEVITATCAQETGAYMLRYDSTDQEIEAFEVSGSTFVEENTTSTAISGRLSCVALCK